MAASDMVTGQIHVGDESFDTAFEGLAFLAYRVARRVLFDGGDAENVASETMARAQLHWSKVHEYAEPWVVTVATRLALREARRSPWPLPHRWDRPQGDHAEEVAARTDLRRALMGLSRRQRQAVAFRYLAGLSDAEGAGAMGCSVPSFRTHCTRGLEALNARLREVPDWISQEQGGVR